MSRAVDALVPLVGLAVGGYLLVHGLQHAVPHAVWGRVVKVDQIGPNEHGNVRLAVVVETADGALLPYETTTPTMDDVRTPRTACVVTLVKGPDDRWHTDVSTLAEMLHADRIGQLVAGCVLMITAGLWLAWTGWRHWDRRRRHP